MRLFLLLGALSLVLWDLVRAATEIGIEERNAKWHRAASKHKGWVELQSESDFDDLIAEPRQHSASILLTSTVSTSINCEPCQSFQPEFETVARSWSNAKDPSRHVFAKIEFGNGKDVFEKLGLQHAPVLLFYPATVGPHADPSNPNGGAPLTYDFNQGLGAERVAEVVSHLLKAKVPYRKPLPWGTITVFTTAALVVGAAFVFIAPHLHFDVWQGTKYIWEAASLVTIIVMCSGFMFNNIRGTPMMKVDRAGNVEYFAGGFQSQYKVETYIISFTYALLAFSFVALIRLVPRQRDPARQRAGVYLWSGVFLSTFSFLFVVFRIKNPSYPFRLFL